MNGVKVCCFEHPPSVYQLGADGRAYLVSGRDLGQVEVGPGDATAAGLEQRVYGPEEGKLFLCAVWISFKGSRMWSERI